MWVINGNQFHQNNDGDGDVSSSPCHFLMQLSVLTGTLRILTSLELIITIKLLCHCTTHNTFLLILTFALLLHHILCKCNTSVIVMHIMMAYGSDFCSHSFTWQCGHI